MKCSQIFISLIHSSAMAVYNPPDQKLVMYISVNCRKGVCKQFNKVHQTFYPSPKNQVSAGKNIQLVSNFKLGKNPVLQTRYFKLKNGKNPVQIDRGYYVLEIAPLSLHARSSPGHLIIPKGPVLYTVALQATFWNMNSATWAVLWKISETTKILFLSSILSSFLRVVFSTF